MAGQGVCDETADSGNQASQEVLAQPAEEQGGDAASGKNPSGAVSCGGTRVFQMLACFFGELAGAERDDEGVGEREGQEQSLDTLADADLQP